VTPPSFDARVVGARALSPSVRELRFERTDGAPFLFEPGQWVSVVLPSDAGEIRRAYSVASPPRGDSTFEIAVTRVEDGPGSRLLHALPVGEALRVIGPQGFFTRRTEKAPPALFIGTGTGQAPLRSMILASLGDAEATEPLSLLVGARSEADLLYGPELEAFARPAGRLDVAATLSRGSSTWEGGRGYVQAHAANAYEELKRRTSEPPHVFICGLERMVGAVRSLFRNDLGLPRALVHSERYD
jgi:ferredoxin-NADP reductase